MPAREASTGLLDRTTALMGPDSPQLVMPLSLRQDEVFIEKKDKLLENPQPQYQIMRLQTNQM
jgi:hypothetical protein